MCAPRWLPRATATIEVVLCRESERRIASGPLYATRSLGAAKSRCDQGRGRLKKKEACIATVIPARWRRFVALCVVFVCKTWLMIDDRCRGLLSRSLPPLCWSSARVRALRACHSVGSCLQQQQ